MSDEVRIYRYTFRLPDETERVFEIPIDAVSLRTLAEPTADLPDWTKLEFNQCSHCPLDAAEVERCPAAVEAVPVVSTFDGLKSYEAVEVRVDTPERSYIKDTSLQTGISALLGLVTASSGCPILEKVRPMVRTHTPFQSREEVSYRFAAAYLLTQYFAARRGETPDWELEGLPGFLDSIFEVNSGMSDRLRESTISDASVNAVVNLANLDALTGMAWEIDRLEELATLFGGAPS